MEIGRVSEALEMYPALRRTARGMMAGTTKEDAVAEAVKLNWRGFGVSLEFVGDVPADEREAGEAANEHLRLIGMLGVAGRSATIALDPARVGLKLGREVASRQLDRLLGEAAIYGLSIVIGAEADDHADDALELYRNASERYASASVGIALHADRERTASDLAEIGPCPGRIKIVQGSRRGDGQGNSDGPKEKVLELIGTAASSGRPVTIASHDESLLREAGKRGVFARPNAEAELPYGIRSDLAEKLMREGVRTRIQLPYGTEWHLFLSRRLSEAALGPDSVIAGFRS